MLKYATRDYRLILSDEISAKYGKEILELLMSNDLMHTLDIEPAPELY